MPGRRRASLVATGWVRPRCSIRAGTSGSAQGSTEDWRLSRGAIRADLQSGPGRPPCALDPLAAALDAHDRWAIVGPRILTPEGVAYPSARLVPGPGGRGRPRRWFGRLFREIRSPAILDAPPPGPPHRGGLGFRRLLPGPTPRRWKTWVASMRPISCSLRIWYCARRLAGPDGRWAEPAAVVTHHEGISRRRHPYRMALAHHRSALRFSSADPMSGSRRVLLPAAAIGLGARLVAVSEPSDLSAPDPTTGWQRRSVEGLDRSRRRGDRLPTLRVPREEVRSCAWATAGGRRSRRSAPPPIQSSRRRHCRPSAGVTESRPRHPPAVSSLAGGDPAVLFVDAGSLIPFVQLAVALRRWGYRTIRVTTAKRSLGSSLTARTC